MIDRKDLALFQYTTIRQARCLLQRTLQVEPEQDSRVSRTRERENRTIVDRPSASPVHDAMINGRRIHHSGVARLR